MVAEQISKEFETFAKEGATAEELDNAKKQIANNLDTDLKEPSYWWGVLRNLDLHKRNLDDYKHIEEAYAQYSAEQVRDVFRKYCQPARTLQVTVVPKPTAGEDAGTSEEAAGVTVTVPQ
jgi:predicted Zn-dependent peptidase